MIYDCNFMKDKIISLLLMLLATTSIAFAQSTQVSGKVLDESGLPFPGASVIVDGTTQGTVTDIDGNFSLSVSDASSKTLSISCIGFETQTVSLANQTTGISVTLPEESIDLEDVVVVGYGTMKKSDLTGSISSVNSDDIVAKGSSNVLGAIQGAVPGVNITQSTGRTGGSTDIQIRGTSSINSGTTPLFVVDGIVCDDIDFLNEQDIEKIDILKDASSTAIYGSRATAGVVMITTKGGLGVKKGSKSSINYDGYYGIAALPRMPDFMNAKEFYQYRFLKFLGYSGGVSTAESGTPNYGMSQSSYAQMALVESSSDPFSTSVLKQMLAEGVDVDWPSIVTQNGKQQNHYLSVNGSTENVSYTMGLGYNQVEGVYVGDETQKFTFKGSLDADINKYVSAGFSINVARIDHDYSSDDGIASAYRLNPFAEPYDENGELYYKPLNYEAMGTDAYQFSDQINPLLYFENEEKKGEEWRLLGNVYLTIKPIDGLTFKTTFSPNYSYEREGQFIGTETGNDQSEAYMTVDKGFSYKWDNVLTYDKLFASIHRINVMGMFSAEAGTSEELSTTYNDVYEGTKWWNLSKNGLDNVTDASSSYSESSMLSYAFRLNYTLMDRYMLTGTIRRDGSSKFNEDNRWGTFPSVALAWRISEENFVKNNVDWISNLKLRLSYGVTGNNSGIGNYAYKLTVSDNGYYPFGSTYTTAMSPSGIVDENLQWEKSNEYNLGLDFGFFNNRLNGSVDIYTKESEDLLYDVTLPYEVGAVEMTTNVGSVKNKGVEVSVTGVIIQNKDWNWSVTANFSHNKNSVEEINGVSESIVSGEHDGNLFIGSSVNNVYGYKWVGVVTDGTMTVPDNEIAASKGFVAGDKVRQTDYYYKCYGLVEGSPIVLDADGDGSIGTEDKQIFRADPKWTGSISTTLTFRGWDFSASVYTKQKYWVYSNFYERYYDYSDRGRVRYNMDFYIPAGTLIDCDGVNDDGSYINPVYQEKTKYGKFPFPNNGGNNSGTQNAYWCGEEGAANYEEVSFVKVKHITLGYSFPKEWIGKIGCEKLRIYATVTNPFVFTDYNGFDPEWADCSLKNDGPGPVTWQFGANIRF